MPVQDHFGGQPYAAAFRALEPKLSSEPTVSYRKLRDMWLKAEFRRAESEALPSPWREFCVSSLEWAAGRDLAALSLLDSASLSQPRWYWMRYYVAEILLRRLDLYELARAEIQGVVQRCPWLWEARNLWAENLMAVGHPDPLKPVRGLAVPEGSRAAFLAWRGALELWWGEYAQAVEDLDEAASMDNPDALCWRGGALCKLGKLAQSKRDLDRLLTLDPKDPEGLVWRGEVHRLLGRREAALKDLADVIAISGDKPWAHANRALLVLSDGGAAAAWREFAETWFPHGHPGALGPCPFDAAGLENLIQSALAAARGCRRSDPHLNAGWMHAAGIPLPSRPHGARLTPWARARGLSAPPERPDPRPGEAEVRAALSAGRARPGGR